MKIQPLLLAACILFGGLAEHASAQELPPAAPPPVLPAARHHARHRRHHTTRLQTLPPAPIGTPAPRQTGSADISPAPVPNEDIGPPRAPADTSTSVDPGNLSIHYPPLGNGYTPGSSPQDMANSQTPKVPGVTVKMPLAQARPDILPPPEAH